MKMRARVAPTDHIVIGVPLEVGTRAGTGEGEGEEGFETGGRIIGGAAGPPSGVQK